MTTNTSDSWWNSLRHEGLLLDRTRLDELCGEKPPVPRFGLLENLRLKWLGQNGSSEKIRELLVLVIENICGYYGQHFTAHKTSIPAEWTCKGFGKETIRPDWLYTSKNQPVLPVFIDSESSRRLGIGRGRNVYAKVLRWLRHCKLNLALLTNGSQWRIVYAGMDHDAFAEWETEQWFAGGAASAELGGFLALLRPELWLGKPSKLLLAVQASRQGQNELSDVMGERVRHAVEMLIREHGAALGEKLPDVSSKDIYMAGVRMVMRLVVVFFAESREGLLPKSNAIYSKNYSLASLIYELKRQQGQRSSMSERYHAWPRLLALLRLIHTGSGHEAMPVPAYGGQLFAPGQEDASDPVSRVMALFENEYRSRPLMSDLVVADLLAMLAENRVRIRQGHAFTTVPMPIDFSSLGNEYIGLLFESLLNFELKYAEADNPIIFLNIGDQPALPLPALEDMDDAEIKALFKTLKKQAAQAMKANSGDDSDEADDEAIDAEEDSDSEDTEEDAEDEDEDNAEDGEDVTEEDADVAAAVRQRARSWAERAATLIGLVRQPKTITQDSALRYEQELQREAKRLLFKIVEPGELYLVRWGGTRKGSGTFYTKPQLAVPTVMRTLRPLAFTQNSAGEWLPKKPRDIIGIKVCDPACGSGSFLLAALRFLTDALYESIQFHCDLENWKGQSLEVLIWGDDAPEGISAQQLPCRPDAEDFEPRLKALLRRYVVERCIYGVDIDPVAIELCRLALWIETLDRELPMTFLDHKIKCGNSLVGAWSDQFMHYPIAAWCREGGDKGHKNGVHHFINTWTIIIKSRLNQAKTDITDILDGTLDFMQPFDYEYAMSELRQNLKSMDALHSININDIAERTRQYAAMRQDKAFIALKDAFDMWCAIWFWPGEHLDYAPLPNDFALERLDPYALKFIRSTAEQNRFFHWELEFPDVFNEQTFGFDAILGNPPWDIAKPKSQEFFSMHDPLYRAYGKQRAIAKQKEYFSNEDTELAWLNYCASFKAMSNWVKNVASPFGDGEGGISLGRAKSNYHARWRAKRGACASRPFQYQGGGDVNLYKLFLEQAHALTKDNGRIGFIVPSGIYSDAGTRQLRELFLKQCNWEWLFSFENRSKIFDIHRSFKFNALVIRKGGTTEKLNAAFMRQNINDWGDADAHSTEYPVSQIKRFSPESLSLLEIKSTKDLEILGRIYENSILVGDESDDGWKIQFSREFDMTNDSKLFPAADTWASWGYRPDEYSRWIKGDWRPIEDLYALPEVAPFVQPSTVIAQAPYDTLRVKRCHVPAGIILSRDCTQWLRYDEIPNVVFTEANGKPITKKIGTGKNAEFVEIKGKAIALPLYEGCMISHFDFSYQGFISGTGNKTSWEEIPWERKAIFPHYLMGEAVVQQLGSLADKAGFRDIGCATNNRTIFRAGFRDMARSTDKRTIYCAAIGCSPCGNTAIVLTCLNKSFVFLLMPVINSFVFDFILRMRMAGTHLSQFIMKPCPVLPPKVASVLKKFAFNLSYYDKLFMDEALIAELPDHFALAPHERLRLKVLCEAVVSKLFGLNYDDMLMILAECDHPVEVIRNKSFARELNQKGFWRVDRELFPELRQTVLSLVAFRDLEMCIERCGGDRDAGIQAFLSQNDGEGWMLPETLRLADYGLGHDERAQLPQPVADQLGPRFYDWQLAQSPDEFQVECRIHAQNLRSVIESPDHVATSSQSAKSDPADGESNGQLTFEF